MEIKSRLNLGNGSKLKILHLLTISLPKLAGYSIRTHNILKYQSNYCFPYAITEPDFLPKKTPDIIDNIIYYRHPPTLGFNCFFNQQVKKMTRKFKVYDWYYRTLFRKNLLFLKKLLKCYPTDIIHVHSSTFYGTFGGLIAKKNKIPFIYELRGFLEDTHVGLGILKENSMLYQRRQAKRRSLLQKANIIVTLGRSMKNELINQGIDGNKISIIPNGVNVEIFRPMTPNLSLKRKLSLEKEFIIGYIGSIRRIEGIEILLKALKIIKERISKIKLLLVGPYDPLYFNDLNILIEKLSIKKNVLFLGKIPNSEIENYYSIIDIIIIPRLNLKVNRLVTPLKPLEAMAMGKVLIVSNLPALRELVKSKISGILFQPENSQDLAGKILEYLIDQDARNHLGKRAREFVKNKFNWKIIIKEYISLYKKLS